MTTDTKGDSVRVHGKTPKVIFDSSFLFTSAQFHMDIYEELARLLNRKFRPIILTPTVEELQRLARANSPKLQKQAALALQVAQKCLRVKASRRVSESHDEVIVRMASGTNSCVATNDKGLRRSLRARNVPVIYLRQRSGLALDGALDGQ